MHYLNVLNKSGLRFNNRELLW